MSSLNKKSVGFQAKIKKLGLAMLLTPMLFGFSSMIGNIDMNKAYAKAKAAVEENQSENSDAATKDESFISETQPEKTNFGIVDLFKNNPLFIPTLISIFMCTIFATLKRIELNKAYIDPMRLIKIFEELDRKSIQEMTKFVQDELGEVNQDSILKFISKKMFKSKYNTDSLALKEIAVGLKKLNNDDPKIKNSDVITAMEAFVSNNAQFLNKRIDSLEAAIASILLLGISATSLAIARGISLNEAIINAFLVIFTTSFNYYLVHTTTSGKKNAVDEQLTYNVLVNFKNTILGKRNQN